MLLELGPQVQRVLVVRLELRVQLVGPQGLVVLLELEPQAGLVFVSMLLALLVHLCLLQGITRHRKAPGI